MSRRNWLGARFGEQERLLKSVIALRLLSEGISIPAGGD